MPDPICPHGCDEHDFGCAGPERVYAMAKLEASGGRLIAQLAAGGSTLISWLV